MYVLLGGNGTSTLKITPVFYYNAEDKTPTPGVDNDYLTFVAPEELK